MTRFDAEPLNTTAPADRRGVAEAVPTAPVRVVTHLHAPARPAPLPTEDDEPAGTSALGWVVVALFWTALLLTWWWLSLVGVV